MLKGVFINKESARRHLEPRKIVALVKEVLTMYGKGAVDMPPKIYLDFKNGDLRVMPAYLKYKDVAGVKIVNSHPKNPLKKLPTVYAVLALYNPATGMPFAYIEADEITAHRTAATTVIATKLLSLNPAKFGFVGCGYQAYIHFLYFSRFFNIEYVYLYDIDEKAAKKFMEFIKKTNKKLEVIITDIECTSRASDVLTTLTPSREPVIKFNYIREGVHINAVGADAPGKEELDPEIIRKGVIVVDDYTQAIHSGEINVPVKNKVITSDDIHASISELLTGKKRLNRTNNDITIFDSTGLAIEDVVVGYYVYKMMYGSKK